MTCVGTPTRAQLILSLPTLGSLWLVVQSTAHTTDPAYTLGLTCLISPSPTPVPTTEPSLAPTLAPAFTRVTIATRLRIAGVDPWRFKQPQIDTIRCVEALGLPTTDNLCHQPREQGFSTGIAGRGRRRRRR